jgi:hypothetical protein
MRNYIKMSASTFVGLVLATPAMAAAGDLSLDVLTEPYFWVAAISAAGMAGLAVGNGVSTRKAKVRQENYARVLATSSSANSAQLA